MLVILSTAPGLRPRPDAGEIIPFIAEITPSIEAMAGGAGSPTSVGGMVTKIEAAKIAVKSGCAVFVGSGDDLLPARHPPPPRAPSSPQPASASTHARSGSPSSPSPRAPSSWTKAPQTPS